MLNLVRDALRARMPWREHDRSEAGITKSAAHRREQLANLGTTAYVRMRLTRLRTRFLPESEKQQAVDDAIVRTAKDAFEVVGNMKGAMMKLAQFVSFQPGVPEGARDELRALQAAAPSMSADLVASCIADELGRRPEEVFARFDREPLASASIGQVHRATTQDGREVAVKVQYPGVDEAIRSDLANADMFVDVVAQTMKDQPDRGPLLREVAARVSEELDYELEAENQRWFAARYRGHPYVKVPAVVDELSTARVLTTEFVDGRGFYDVLDDPQSSRDRLGEIMFRFAFNSVLVDGVFSGDPHPGNYLFMDDGRVCFLDFGLVKRMTADERSLIRAPMQAMVEGDRAALRSSLLDVGVLRPDATLDDDALWEVFEKILGHVSEDRPVRCSIEASADLREDRRERRGDLRGQLEFTALVLFFMRYRRGTWSVLAHLGAEGNWHRLLREILYGEAPSTEIGERWSAADRAGSAPES